MTTVRPLALVEAPNIQPYKYGLFSVAQQVDVTDPHQLLGVHYEPLGTYTDAVTAGDCWSTPTSNLAPNTYHSTIVGLPFGVWSGVDGSAVGHSEKENTDRAYTVLRNGRQHAVEQALFTGAGDAPGLAAASLAATVNATATGVVSAIAQIEEWAGNNYPGQVTLHLPVVLSAYMGRNQQMQERLGHLETWAGSQIAFGRGYGRLTPAGGAAATNVVWVYCTGPVTVRAGQPFLPAGLGQLLNRTTNDLVLYAEQQHVLTADGPVGAIPVDLTQS